MLFGTRGTVSMYLSSLVLSTWAGPKSTMGIALIKSDSDKACRRLGYRSPMYSVTPAPVANCL